MRTHATVYAGTSDADKDSEIPARPSWILIAVSRRLCRGSFRGSTLVSFTVCAAFVAFDLDECL